MDSCDRDVVVTGISAWTPFGRGIAVLLDALAAGRAEVWPLRDIDVSDPYFYAKSARQIPAESSIASSIDGTVLEVSPEDWPGEMAVQTALDAVVDASRPHRDYPAMRIAICSGTSHGCNHGLIEYLRQTLQEGRDPDARLLADAAAIIARRIGVAVGALGPNLTFNTACSSGINAIGQGMRLLCADRADCVVAGAHDTFSELSLLGFTSLKAIDGEPCRPFDVHRNGLTLGDGAAYVVLERRKQAQQRGAQILATLTGYGFVAEGHHATAPDPNGEGARRAMQIALNTDPAPRELTLVCAHGTGTPANDAAEALAVERIASHFEVEHAIDIVSLKSQLGHSLGAAGAVQAVATIGCLRRDLVPANIGLTEPIEHANTVRLPSKPRRGVTALAVCNALGFGGAVASLCVRRNGDQDE